jgi:hypothetical protein
MTETFGACCLCDGDILERGDSFCPTCAQLPFEERSAIFRSWAATLRLAERAVAIRVFDLRVEGVIYPLSRNAAHVHPPAVHQALETTTETELQFFLDTLMIEDFFTYDGTYRGRDAAGIGIVGQDKGTIDGTERHDGDREDGTQPGDDEVRRGARTAVRRHSRAHLAGVPD